MLFRVFPASSAPTIIFALSYPTPPSALPLPHGYAQQLNRILADQLDSPPNPHSLDRAAWALSLLDTCTFDLAVASVVCVFVDGVRAEWTLPPACLDVLGRVVDIVRESAAVEEREASSSDGLRTSSQSRVLRHRARSDLVDAYRRFVQPELVARFGKNEPGGFSFSAWAARSMLKRSEEQMDRMIRSHHSADYFHEWFSPSRSSSPTLSRSSSPSPTTPCGSPLRGSTPVDFADAENPFAGPRSTWDEDEEEYDDEDTDVEEGDDYAVSSKDWPRSPSSRSPCKPSLESDPFYNHLDSLCTRLRSVIARTEVRAAVTLAEESTAARALEERVRRRGWSTKAHMGGAARDAGSFLPTCSSPLARCLPITAPAPVSMPARVESNGRGVTPPPIRRTRSLPSDPQAFPLAFGLPSIRLSGRKYHEAEDALSRSAPSSLSFTPIDEERSYVDMDVDADDEDRDEAMDLDLHLDLESDSLKKSMTLYCLRAASASGLRITPPSPPPMMALPTPVPVISIKAPAAVKGTTSPPRPVRSPARAGSSPSMIPVPISAGKRKSSAMHERVRVHHPEDGLPHRGDEAIIVDDPRMLF
ncbi:hypothetical protein BOTBODRAFT_39777 [Botryobasidium botryosum FD-172 SS1]|uniref:Uncharacterized protein n=1 Tax=Botryobasidium botryosum (strain FD-172 SS1) TaxID=930990 RepID=A0A067M3M5_BOTB1|nr:hypothetical protein BOTBODRAFT_39777 [Botryobasidium botryosum FD-172 SS1]